MSMKSDTIDGMVVYNVKSSGVCEIIINDPIHFHTQPGRVSVTFYRDKVDTLVRLLEQAKKD